MLSQNTKIIYDEIDEALLHDKQLTINVSESSIISDDNNLSK
jgi:hypothetical protein